MTSLPLPVRAACLSVLACGSALAQGLNVDLGPNLILAPAPDSTYGGALNQTGEWNAFAPALVPTPLLDLTGNSAGVTLFSDSSSSATVFPSVMPPGPDQNLMEDLQVTPSLNTLVTWTLEGLTDGPYVLAVYASDPSNASVQVEVGVPSSGSANQIVGGGWPGMHVQGVTYALFNVTVTGGTLEFTAEVVGNQFDSGVVNGFQIMPITVPPLGFVYCSSNPNSTGQAAWTSASGSAVVASDQLRFQAGGLPPGSFAYFLTSRTQGMAVNPGGSQGILCLGGNVGRFNALVGPADGLGVYEICTLSCDPARTFTVLALPTPTGAVAAQPGETWSFQAWYRDALPGGGATSNFSEGYQLTFQ